jgi:5-methylcytosine-specific restriction endonuclease McrA
MGRLRNLAPQVKGLKPRITTQRDLEGHSPKAEPWRDWYNSPEWKHPEHGLRIKVLRRDRFTCQCGCGRSDGDTSKLVADHKIPHRGDPDLFWSEANLQTLLKSPCHDRIKQAEERRALDR